MRTGHIKPSYGQCYPSHYCISRFGIGGAFILVNPTQNDLLARKNLMPAQDCVTQTIRRNVPVGSERLAVATVITQPLRQLVSRIAIIIVFYFLKRYKVGVQDLERRPHTLQVAPTLYVPRYKSHTLILPYFCSCCLRASFAQWSASSLPSSLLWPRTHINVACERLN